MTTYDVTMPEPMNFAIYYAGDAYSTSQKIMGRQSAGKSFMRGVVAASGEHPIAGFGLNVADRNAMVTHLRGEGFQGPVQWHYQPGSPALDQIGAVYYPAPAPKDLLFARNVRNPAGFSVFGVTHTLSSDRAMDGVAAPIAAPYKPWDALVCTSTSAKTVVTGLQNELRAWMQQSLGATRFNSVVLPVIPLGVAVDEMAFTASERASAREDLKIAHDEVAFLFAGRLSFHAKANPAIFYKTIEEAARRTGQKVVCIEAGVFRNDGQRNAFAEAQRVLAPSVRFMWVNGEDEAQYRAAWRAGDVFVTLSDNVQETFGLTPVEAMAAGMPVLVSDWNGYKDTVRDGVDGFRVPVYAPPVGAGRDLMQRYAVGLDTYDFFIGRASLATVVDPEILLDRLVRLIESPDLRAQMGLAGQARARAEYDWPMILRQYRELAVELGKIRQAAGGVAPEPWPNRSDPFRVFAGHATALVSGSWAVEADATQASAVAEALTLGVMSYSLDQNLTAKDEIPDMHRLAATGDQTVGSVIAAMGGGSPQRVRAIMWLAKMGLIRLRRR